MGFAECSRPYVLRAARSQAIVIVGSAATKQFKFPRGPLDCFAEFIIGPATPAGPVGSQ